MPRDRHSYITDILSCGQPRTLQEICKRVTSTISRNGHVSAFYFDVVAGINYGLKHGLVVEHPARYQLASAVKSPQPATTAADLLAIERSLNDGLRKELDHTHAALTAALAMLTPEQAANLIAKPQEAKP